MSGAMHPFPYLAMLLLLRKAVFFISKVTLVKVEFEPSCLSEFVIVYPQD